MDRLTIPEYELLMEAVRLKQTDMNYRNHLQAFLNFAVKASNRNGRPRFKKFKQFFDYEKEIKRAKRESGEVSKSALPDMSKFFKKGV